MLIVDCSVAIAWVVAERATAVARDILEQPDRLSAPDVFWSECANALWAKTQRGELSDVSAGRALDALLMIGIADIPSRPLANDALRLGRLMRHPVYDAMYLAAALSEDAVVVTLDQRFAAAAETAGYGDRIRLLTA